MVTALRELGAPLMANVERTETPVHDHVAQAIADLRKSSPDFGKGLDQLNLAIAACGDQQIKALLEDIRADLVDVVGRLRDPRGDPLADEAKHVALQLQELSLAV